MLISVGLGSNCFAMRTVRGEERKEAQVIHDCSFLLKRCHGCGEPFVDGKAVTVLNKRLVECLSLLVLLL